MSEPWGPFHRHFASDRIYLDSECFHESQPSRPVYCFDPDYLDEHDEAIRADERERIASLLEDYGYGDAAQIARSGGNDGS